MRYIILFIAAAFMATISACDDDGGVGVANTYCKYTITSHDRPSTILKPDPLLDEGNSICIQCTQGMGARGCSFPGGGDTYSHDYVFNKLKGNIKLRRETGWGACKACDPKVVYDVTKWPTLEEVFVNEIP